MSGAAPSGTRVARAGWLALALVALTNTVSLLDRQILAILAPRIKHDLRIGDAEMGLLYGTVFALFYALFSLPLGRLADGWVRTRLLALALVVWSAATALGGLATGFATLAAARLGVGVGEAAAAPAGTSLIYDYWPRPRRGLAMAVLAAAIALGIGGSLVLGGIAADWWDARHPAAALHGWQFAFLIAALPGFALAFALRRLPEPPRGAIDGMAAAADPAPFAAAARVLAAVVPPGNWWLMARNRAAPGAWRASLAALALIGIAMAGLSRWCGAIAPRPPLAFGALRISPHALQWGVTGIGLYALFNLVQALARDDPPAHRVITGSPTLLMVIAAGTLQSVINYGMMGFNPSFLMRTYQLSLKETALQFGLLSAAMGIAGPLLWGPLSDALQARFPGSGRAWTALFCMGVSPLLAGWVYHAPTVAGFYARFVPYSLVLTGWLPPLYAILYDQVLPRMRGTTASLYLLASTILGMGIGPYTVGLIADATGDLRLAMLAINGVAVPIVVLMLAVARRADADQRGLPARAGEGTSALPPGAAPPRR